jgi:hypothetical protein
MLAWGKMYGAAGWLDLSTYRYLLHVRPADATYYTVFGHSQTNHQVEARRRTGGPITSITYTFSPAGPLDWFCMGLTFAQSIPRLTFYIWSSLTGFVTAGTSNSANLATWGNNVPTDGTTVWWAGSLTLQEWIGAGAYPYVWCGVEFTAADMRRLMTP